MRKDAINTIKGHRRDWEKIFVKRLMNIKCFNRNQQEKEPINIKMGRSHEQKKYGRPQPHRTEREKGKCNNDESFQSSAETTEALARGKGNRDAPHTAGENIKWINLWGGKRTSSYDHKN